MKRFLVIALVALMAGNVFAQEQTEARRPDNEKMTKMQIKRIVKELALDNYTAEEFTKTYTLYKEECNKVNEKFPVLHFADLDEEKPAKKGKKNAEEPMLPTDEEVEKQILDSFARERELLNLKEKFYKEFCKILTPQQIQKMYRMENAPRQRMQNGNMPQGGPGNFPGGFPGGRMGGGMTPPPGGMW